MSENVKNIFTKITSGLNKSVGQPRVLPRLGLMMLAVAIVGSTSYLGSTIFKNSFAATNRSGLPWQSGVGASDYEGFGTWRGRPIDVTTTWDDAGDWNAIEQLWTVPQFHQAGYQGKLSFAMPLLDNAGSDLGSCANGAYNSHFATVAQKLVSNNWPNAYIRLGWEMNGDWYAWSARTNTNAWINCYRQAHDAMKAVAGNAFQFEWNPTKDSSHMGNNLNAVATYPGDTYVDIVGIDYYDQWPAYQTQASWDSGCNQTQNGGPFGICTWLTFAKQHGKKLSVPEWGIASDPGGASGGFDNPLFIQNMYNFFNTNAVDIAYESYFDLQGCTFQLHTDGCNPNASAMYQKLWGTNVTTSAPISTPAPTATPAPASTPAPVTSKISQTNNLANGKTFVSSANESTSEPGNPLTNINDKNEATRWISQPQDNVSVSTNLGANFTLSKVSILWAGDTVKNYDLQMSSDNTTWKTVASGVTNNSQQQLIDTTSFTVAPTGQYFRIVAKDRWNVSYGNSIWEIGLYGTVTAASTPAPTSTPTPISTPFPTQTPAYNGDITGDNRVNTNDLAIILTHYGQSYAPADINHDGKVGAADLSIVLSTWTW